MGSSMKTKNPIINTTNVNSLFIKRSYAGIGARITPPITLGLMEAIATRLEKDNFHLRSGGAGGADTAFDRGCKNNDNKTIYIPYDGFKGLRQFYPITAEAMNIAEQNHPNWKRLPGYAKDLMARNVYQILSHTLDEPVEFVICWTPDGCIHHSTRTRETGGTGLAIEIASKNNIPVYNLNVKDHYDRFIEYTKFDENEYLRKLRYTN